VLEVGCGAGQLARFLFDQNIGKYTGFDFSQTAVDLARGRVPQGDFFVASALDTDLYRKDDVDVIVCTEVLEHIQQDLSVVAKFPAGKTCICTVPNFPFKSHVRHFVDAGEVRDRYGPFFRDLDVMTLRSSESSDNLFFLFEGVRNDFEGSTNGPQ
jgi:SAM-dependent methyltransferase